MYERHRVSRISIDFRVLDDDNGVNSNSMIDHPKLHSKFNVEESETLSFLFTRPRMMTPKVEVHRKLLQGFTNKDFQIFFYERLNSCVRDMLSSIQILQPDNQKYLQEQIIHGACEKFKDLSSAMDPKTDINVDFKLRIIEVLDDSGEISVFMKMKFTSRDAIRALGKKVVIEEGDLLQTCAVCLDEFQKGMEVKTMPCSHIFHEDCIVEWLRKSNKCPLCRFEIPV